MDLIVPFMEGRGMREKGQIEPIVLVLMLAFFMILLILLLMPSA